MTRSRCWLSTSGMLGDPWSPFVLMLIMIIGLVIMFTGKASASEEQVWYHEDEECEDADGKPIDCDVQFDDNVPDEEPWAWLSEEPNSTLEARVTEGQPINMINIRCPQDHQLVPLWVRLPEDGHQFFDYEVACQPTFMHYVRQMSVFVSGYFQAWAQVQRAHDEGYAEGIIKGQVEAAKNYKHQLIGIVSLALVLGAFPGLIIYRPKKKA